MQDGINSNASYQFNSKYDNYTYVYYSNSDAKTALDTWYQTNIGNKSDLANKVARGDYYCEQAQVTSSIDCSTLGSATMNLSSSYTPNFKCLTDGNGKGVVNANIGLLTYDEVVYAGGYYNQSNNNYYLIKGLTSGNYKYFWTMSPNCFKSSTSNSVYDVNIIFNGNYLGLLGSGSITNSPYLLRPILILKADTQALGTGTSSDPFVVK